MQEGACAALDLCAHLSFGCRGRFVDCRCTAVCMPQRHAAGSPQGRGRGAHTPGPHRRRCGTGGCCRQPCCSEHPGRSESVRRSHEGWCGRLHMPMHVTTMEGCRQLLQVSDSYVLLCSAIVFCIYMAVWGCCAHHGSLCDCMCLRDTGLDHIACCAFTHVLMTRLQAECTCLQVQQHMHRFA